MPALPLRRNRDFMLLQGGQLLSSAGSQVTAIAYPLLVLGLTGSPADAGLVTFARLVPFALWPNVYVLVASMLPAAMAIPITDSVVIGHRVAVTPDRLIGRVESVRSTIALLVAPLGPLCAGVLLSEVSARATSAVFFAVAVVLAVWGTSSPAIRDAPRLDELAPTRSPQAGSPGRLARPPHPAASPGRLARPPRPAASPGRLARARFGPGESWPDARSLAAATGPIRRRRAKCVRIGTRSPAGCGFRPTPHLVCRTHVPPDDHRPPEEALAPRAGALGRRHGRGVRDAG